MKFKHGLPNYYITKNDAKSSGWKQRKGNLHETVPGKMIYGGEFFNSRGKLPMTPGRKWYEADINYISGFRNHDRILFSNDGLIFITYDHYETFIEIL